MNEWIWLDYDSRSVMVTKFGSQCKPYKLRKPIDQRVEEKKNFLCLSVGTINI